MIQIFCTIALAVSAVYCGGMWLWLAVITGFNRAGDEGQRRAVATDTFHLGLCFVISVGFLGVLVK